MLWGVRIAAFLGTALAALVPAVATARPAPSYHSPGYKGKSNFARRVVAKPLPSITLGTGKYPNLLVDGAGTAHIAYAVDGGGNTRDTFSYCGLQRGIKSCAQATDGYFPQEPEGDQYPSNNPIANQDFDGPIPLDVGNELYIVDRRFPDEFPTPGGGTSESNVFLWSSDDGGQTQLTGPGLIGDNEMGGGATVYGGSVDPSIGTLTSGQTGGTFFQGSAAGMYTQEKAQLGDPDQAYDGSIATDGNNPIVAFDDTSDHTFIREWSGSGDVNDPSTWSESSITGASPHIVSGPGGVFLLYRDNIITESNVFVRRIVGGQPAGAQVKLGNDLSNITLSEDPSGRLAFAYSDTKGVELETSTDGVHFTPPQLLASAPNGEVGHLSVAATADGGGFATFVKGGSGAEDVGPVVASAFGTQQATRNPGLGQLPGGGIGSQPGDQLATSSCTTAKFGAVTVKILSGCYLHDPDNPQADVSLGELDLNGLSIIPELGVKIEVNPKQHTIDSTGNVSVVLKGPGINITIWHGQLHVKLPIATPGTDLFDFPEITPPDIAGFPVSGDVDVKLTNGGVQVPISLSLPKYFGGVTGQATLEATLDGGLQLDSLEFKVGDADFGALELKDVDVSWTRSGNVWKGSGTLNVPTGGSALSVMLSLEFDDGDFRSGNFVVGLPYPGVPFDLSDTPPQLYLTKGGLGLGLNPLSLTGTIGFGISPVSTPGVGGSRDYVFSLDGSLTASFGTPVTITVTATGFLYKIQIAKATLTYKLPDQVQLNASAGYDLGVIEAKGDLNAIIDPADDKYGGEIDSEIVIHLAKLGLPTGSFLSDGDITIPSEKIAINNNGFGVYIPFGQVPLFFGTITYHWGDPFPVPHFGSQDLSEFTSGIPGAASDRVRGHAAAASFTFHVPAHAQSADVEVTGAGGAPAVVLTTPGGLQLVPADRGGSGVSAVAFGDPAAGVTHVGIVHPAAGTWTVAQQDGTGIAIAAVKYAIGEPAPVVNGSVSGTGSRRTLHYHVKLPKNVTVSFAEQTTKLLHVIGTAKHASGTLEFKPAFGPAGRRQIVAEISNGGLPTVRKVIATYVAPKPPSPGRARRVRVTATKRAFAVSFTPPANSVKTLIEISATDGRRLHELVSIRTRRISVPVIGYRDGITVTVVGVGVDGRRGPAAKAHARRKK